LIIGQEIELAVQHALDEPAPAASQPGDELVRALASYRMGDLDRMRAHLALITAMDRLTPGERAILAGLTAIGGDSGAAYRIGEKVPDGLLLAEEQSFLRRAL
jgi:hypothetical protein